MSLIQALDLAVGIFYTASGVVGLGISAFPMFNASLFILLPAVWRPKAPEAAGKQHTHRNHIPDGQWV